MPWPPPGFEKPSAQRDLRVLVHAGHPYIHTGDLADWVRAEVKKGNGGPVALDVAGTIAEEIRALGDRTLRKYTERRGDGRDERGELSGLRERPPPSCGSGDARPRGTPRSLGAFGANRSLDSGARPSWIPLLPRRSVQGRSL